MTALGAALIALDISAADLARTEGFEAFGRVAEPRGCFRQAKMVTGTSKTRQPVANLGHFSSPILHRAHANGHALSIDRPAWRSL